MCMFRSRTLPLPSLSPSPPLPLSMLWHWVAITSFIAEPKGEASNRDALSFRVGMYVCMYVCMYVYLQIAQCNSMLVYVYPQRLHNTILCSRMYIRHACTTIAQFSNQNVPPGTIYGHGLLPGLRGPYLMEEHNHKRFKSQPCSLRIAYTISVTL